jgi:hypothetical protein
MDILNDRYQIQHQLGKKPGRQTLLALDLQTQQQVVIKLLLFGYDFEWDALKLFEREAETLRSIDQPAIPRYLDFFDIELPTARGFALVQSYIEAKSLEEHLSAGRTFSEAEVRQLAERLLEILIYLHNQLPPIIHRDIKPSNILLGDRSGHDVGQVYLVDFGSVQTLVAQEGGTITVVGTYGYMPPEQYGGRSVPASDLYSLGATLIYLLTGKHPADLVQRNFQIQFHTGGISELFVAWLHCMTQPDWIDRPGSAQFSLDMLRSVRLGQAPKALHPIAEAPILGGDRKASNKLIRWAASQYSGFTTGAGAVTSYAVTYLFTPADDRIELRSFGAMAILFVLLGIGMGALNGFVLAKITEQFFVPLRRRQWVYRFHLGALATGLSVAEIALLTNMFNISFGINWQTDLVVLALLAAAIMGSQVFATWYIRQNHKLS